MRTLLYASLALTLGVAACAPPEQRTPGVIGEANKTTAGTVIGAVGGGLLGAQIGRGGGNLAAIAVGTLLGGFIGHQIGESLDRSDIEYARRAQERAYYAPIGQEITWNNPQTGHAGGFVPQRDGTDRDGHYCREYQSIVTVDGRSERAYGTACRQPDGSWRVVGP